MNEAEKLVEELVELEMESEKTKEQKCQAKKLVEGEKTNRDEGESNGAVQSNQKVTRRNRKG